MLMTGRYLLPRASLYEQLVYPLLPGGGGEKQDRAVPPPWHQPHDQWVIVVLMPAPRSPIGSSGLTEGCLCVGVAVLMPMPRSSRCTRFSTRSSALLLHASCSSDVEAKTRCAALPACLPVLLLPEAQPRASFGSMPRAQSALQPNLAGSQKVARWGVPALLHCGRPLILPPLGQIVRIVDWGATGRRARVRVRVCVVARVRAPGLRRLAGLAASRTAPAAR
eukprot:COSAG01_NODE_15970_length_1282_cov_0.808115_1_plen_222_part_00